MYNRNDNITKVNTTKYVTSMLTDITKVNSTKYVTSMLTNNNSEYN